MYPDTVCRPAILLLIAAPLLSFLPAACALVQPSSTIPTLPSQPSDIFSGLRTKRDAKAYDKPSDWGGSMLTVSLAREVSQTWQGS